jgi:general stress protein 26
MEKLAVGLQLIERSKICLLGTKGEDGYPNIKAILNMTHEGIKKIRLSTNTLSKRVQQLKKDSRARCLLRV